MQKGAGLRCVVGDVPARIFPICRQAEMKCSVRAVSVFECLHLACAVARRRFGLRDLVAAEARLKAAETSLIDYLQFPEALRIVLKSYRSPKQIGSLRRLITRAGECRRHEGGHAAQHFGSGGDPECSRQRMMSWRLTEPVGEAADRMRRGDIAGFPLIAMTGLGRIASCARHQAVPVAANSNLRRMHRFARRTIGAAVIASSRVTNICTICNSRDVVNICRALRRMPRRRASRACEIAHCYCWVLGAIALDVADLEKTEGWIAITTRRSKTDQEGVGAMVAICRGSIPCPVKAVKEYLDGPPTSRAGRTSGASGEVITPPTSGSGAESIRKLVKAQAAKLGLNPKEFGAHSLRAGLRDICRDMGADLFKIMDVTRNKSLRRSRAM
jgi:hypothetical protein